MPQFMELSTLMSTPRGCTVSDQLVGRWTKKEIFGMFMTFDGRTMYMAIQSVMSVPFEKHDGLREGLWRPYVVHRPYLQWFRVASYHVSFWVIIFTQS